MNKFVKYSLKLLPNKDMSIFLSFCFITYSWNVGHIYFLSTLSTTQKLFIHAFHTLLNVILQLQKTLTNTYDFTDRRYVYWMIKVRYDSRVKLANVHQNFLIKRMIDWSPFDIQISFPMLKFKKKLGTILNQVKFKLFHTFTKIDLLTFAFSYEYKDVFLILRTFNLIWCLSLNFPSFITRQFKIMPYQKAN